MVVLDEGALTFEHGNIDSGLLVLVRGECLSFFGGDDGSAGNDLGHDATNCLNTKSKRSHIDEEDVRGLFSGLTAEDASLDGGAVSDGLVGVDAAIWLLSIEEVLHQLLDLGDTGGATDKHDLINFALFHACVVKHLLDGLEGFLEQVGAELLETRARNSLFEVDAVDEALDRELNLDDGGKVTLGLLDFTPQLCNCASVLLDVDAVLLLEQLDEVV